MATENYVYFPCEASTLPARFGGGAIVSGTSGGNATPRTITMRNLAKALSYPKNDTNSFFRYGTVSGAEWVRTTQDVYDAISSELRTSETAGMVTSAPVGFSLNGNIALFMPKPHRINVHMIGDSISAGVSTTAGFADSPMAQASTILDPTRVINSIEDSERSYLGDKWAFHNLANGGSSWANTDSSNTQSVDYPQVFNLSYNQLFKSLCLKDSEKCILCVWLGTNDLKYGFSSNPNVTASTVWSRMTTHVGNLRTEFPDVTILSGTIIIREDGATLNGRINDLNTMIINDHASIGFDGYIPYHLAHPSFHPITGNSDDEDVFALDGSGNTDIHPNTVGAGYLAQALATKLTAVATAKGWL